MKEWIIFSIFEQLVTIKEEMITFRKPNSSIHNIVLICNLVDIIKSLLNIAPSANCFFLFKLFYFLKTLGLIGLEIFGCQGNVPSFDDVIFFEGEFWMETITFCFYFEFE